MFKKFFLSSFVFSLANLISVQIYAKSSIQDQMIQDLDVAKYHFSVMYAPSDWKKEYVGWSLDKAYAQAKRRIKKEKPATCQEYHKILNQFFKSTNDYHVGIEYHSTACAVSPFYAKKASNRYFLVSLDREINPEEEFDSIEQFIELTKDDDLSDLLQMSEDQKQLLEENIKGIAVGDEIIKFNGQPIHQVIESLIDENFNGDRSETGYELAVKNLFLRKANLGQDVPQGTFTLTLKNPKTQRLVTRIFPWLYIPELVPNTILKDRKAYFGESQEEKLETPVQTIGKLLKKDYSVRLAKELSLPHLLRSLSNAKLNENKKDRRTKGNLPPLGEIVWETDLDNNVEFYAYLYKDRLSDKLIGYIYLPTFDVSGLYADYYMKEVIKTIEVFNNQAEGLVFDITDNDGGDPFFMYALLALLTDKPLKLPTEREIISQEKVKELNFTALILNNLSVEKSNLKESLSGYLITDKVVSQLQNYAASIVQLWENGEVFTPPMYPYGIDQIEPHPTCRFTKPLIVLTNAYCFSCADFFPAILQDNQRATIFGQKTAGAGGYVFGYKSLSRFGISYYTLTGSIAYRLNGLPIENLGVTPDVPYQITKNDIRRNYRPYIRKVNATMNKLIK